MGLKILGHIVTIDPTTNEHLITSTLGNPKIFSVSNSQGSIDVVSVFTRQKSTSHQRRQRSERRLGDNCPLIYALKNLDGLSTNFTTIKYLLDTGRAILGTHFQPPVGFSLVCTPSSHKIVKNFARAAGDILGASVHFNALEKASVASAIVDLQNAVLNATLYEDRKLLNNQIQKLKGQTILALKDVSPKLRLHINPVTLGANASNLGSVFIVDDLVSSGTTLIAAKNVLNSTGTTQAVGGLSLFSNV